MNCLIFIFTLCSIGTFIDGHGEPEANTVSALPDNDNPSDDIEPPEESIKRNENSNFNETSNGSEDEFETVDPTEVIVMQWDEQNNPDESNELQSETDIDSESETPEVYQLEAISEEDENNNPGITSSSLEDESGYLGMKPEDALMDSDPEDEKDKEKKLEVMKLYMNEIEAGNMADLIGQNQHILQSPLYKDLGRRSEPQGLNNNEAETPDYLIPKKASPELVLSVAKTSKLLREGKDNDLNDFDRNKLLRSGNYWDGFWKEEVVPKSVLRTAPQEKELGSIKVKINPGTEFFKVASRMKKISPKLLYIINKK